MDIINTIIVWVVSLCCIGVLFPLTLIVWLIVLPFDKSRSVTHWLLVYQSVFMTVLMPVWKINILGREKAIKSTTYVIIANHQSVLDILLLNSLRYRFRWISKVENMKVPVLGWYLRMAGYITVNRSNEESKVEMLEKSYQSLKEGISVMIFPEGTRSSDGEIAFYKRGAFQLAIKAGVPILPVIIDGTSKILPRHSLKFGRGYEVRIKVLDPVSPGAFGTDNPDILSVDLHQLMKKELSILRSESGS